MKTMTMSAVAGLFLLAFAGTQGVSMAGAQAQDAPYGCACLHNLTQQTVKFRYKWGDGEWKPDYLRAGYQETLCWRYAAGSTSSPNLSFQIDIDLTGGTAWTTFALPRVQSKTNKCEAVASKYHYDINYKPNTNKQFLMMTHRK